MKSTTLSSNSIYATLSSNLFLTNVCSVMSRRLQWTSLMVHNRLVREFLYLIKYNKYNERRVKLWLFYVCRNAKWNSGHKITSD